MAGDLMCSPELAERVIRVIDGRWKMPVLYRLYGGDSDDFRAMRFSDLERAIPQISQKMLIHVLRELEQDGVVSRTIYPEVPPRVEYRLTAVGIELRPALRALLTWAELWMTAAPSKENQAKDSRELRS
jgi:DNA-binding HxlR family transcriptional regulator